MRSTCQILLEILLRRNFASGFCCAWYGFLKAELAIVSPGRNGEATEDVATARKSYLLNFK